MNIKFHKFSNYFNEVFYFKQKNRKDRISILWKEKLERSRKDSKASKEFNGRWH